MNWKQADEVAKEFLQKLVTEISEEVKDELNSYPEEDQTKIRSRINFYLEVLERINSN